jgi:predicted MFS family arabinose efflux permease
MPPTNTHAMSSTTIDHGMAGRARSAEEFASGKRLVAIVVTLMLIQIISQVDRILPFILAESIKRDLSLSDTQMGLITGLAFAVCYTLLSLPLARASDRGSPRAVLVSCILVWSAMTAMGGLSAGFLFLAMTRFGVAFGEAGAIPAGHALIARKIRPERRGLVIGLFSMGIPLGTMIGFAAGGAVADTLGWRSALVGAGLVGGLVAVLTLVVVGPTPPRVATGGAAEPFLKASLRLAMSPRFRWLMVAAVIGGFASAPFYAFSAPFLMRTHGLTASEVGLSFGLLQGLMGLIGTLVGGRLFDNVVRSGSGRVFGPPGLLFLLASLTTAAAWLAPTGWMSIALLVPGMLSFAFLMPWAFGGAHLLAGAGNQALGSSLILIGSGLLGPALAPVMVGIISDAAASADIPNGLGLGLMIVPVASFLTGLTLLVANRRASAWLRRA